MTTFSDLSLDPRVLEAVSEAGYETPTPIQIQAIPHALEGRDVLGIAQTGTGKTGAFVLPMLCALSKGRARARMPRSLVLAPTRELAAQVAEQFEKYSKHLKLSMALLIGGVSFKDQDKLIDRGVDVLVATPGRLLDHFERGKLMLTGVQIMVVDEADRMLDMGFIPDIERIFKLVPFTRQTLFFSATMAPEITRITDTFLHNPVRVEVARQATTSETISQWVVKHIPRRKDTGPSEKREILRRLIRAEGDALTNGIIFCNRKVEVDVLAKSLKKHGFDAAALHGDLDQKLRMAILGQFRDGELKLLIASDVAARGLDIPNVSHVINFDVPIHPEDYVHRIGRTGRAGRAGTSITLCLPHDEKHLARIEELVKKAVPVRESPLAGGAPTEDVAAEPAAERGGAGRRERARGGRGGRSGARPTGPAPASEREEAAPAPAAAAVAAERSDRPRHDGGRRRGAAGERVAPGMGDHVPAFLLREFRVPASAADTEEDEDQPAVPAAKASRPRKAVPVETVEAVAEAAGPADAAEAAGSVDAAEVVQKAPAKRRAPRRRRAAEPAAAEAEVEVSPSAA
ncbi:DEAD/DEAH box helicase [Amaricoccus sp.]|uniref:DEAD/DEAH box helicase n=1 Tax=Amaricoccus sp. TaxID=1872485 RepID=UPI001B5B52B5|nr:DEAD/DEAH box helicase [Amaricoccus sp.]MBP7242083.1 DEAD/DEAH box helicase [Amaricoccus sp.]